MYRSMPDSRKAYRMFFMRFGGPAQMLQVQPNPLSKLQLPTTCRKKIPAELNRKCNSVRAVTAVYLNCTLLMYQYHCILATPGYPTHLAHFGLTRFCRAWEIINIFVSTRLNLAHYLWGHIRLWDDQQFWITVTMSERLFHNIAAAISLPKYLT